MFSSSPPLVPLFARFPAPTVDSASCENCLLTIAPFDGYPQDVWEDHLESGVTERYFALQSAGGDRNPPGPRHTNPADYLRQAAQFVRNLHHKHLRSRFHRRAKPLRRKRPRPFRTLPRPGNGRRPGRDSEGAPR
jgi:hypothetical protein